MISTSTAIILGVTWVYLVLGVMIALSASDVTISEVSKRPAKEIIGWFIAQATVAIFWSIFVMLGVIDGIHKTFRR